jgi:hypothetical protein
MDTEVLKIEGDEGEIKLLQRDVLGVEVGEVVDGVTRRSSMSFNGSSL